MFLGVIPDGFRKIIANYLPEFKDEVYVLCSGNFTSEAVLCLNGYQGDIYSCDVCVYSCALGAYLTGQPFNASLVDPENEVPFLNGSDYFSSELKIASTILMLSDLGEFAKRNNDYKKRMFDGMVLNWDALFEKTVSKLEQAKDRLRIKGYFAEDAMQVLDKIPGGATVMTYVPTTGGDYEKMFAWINKLITWDEPQYDFLTDSEPFYKKITDADFDWYVYAEHELHDEFPFLGEPVSALQKRNLRVNLYTKTDKSFYIGNHSKTSICKYQFLTDEEITNDSELEVTPVKAEIVDYLRTLFLQKQIEFTQATFNYAVTIDGLLVGILCYNFPNFNVSVPDHETGSSFLYLLSDTAVKNDNYPLLGKLILYASLSSEMKQLLERRCVSKFDFWLTTAFSRNPVSMKYRGVYKIATRKDNSDPERPYMLNYFGTTGQWDLKKALKIWLKKQKQKSIKH